MKLFKDIETGEYITESDLLEEFGKKILETPQEYKHITFEQYVNNCLTRNNGTLEEVGMENWRMHECIFDITTVVYGEGGLRWQDWWPQDLDSREVFRQVCECAKFYEDFFPDDDSGDYLFDIEMLARAWFKDEYDEPLTQEEKSYLFKDQRIGAYIRLHLDEGWDEYDYDNWCNVEYVVGEQINDKEYHALNGIFDSLAELGVGDKAEVKAKLEEIRHPEKEYVVRILQRATVDFSVVVKAHSKEEAKRIFEERNNNDMYWDEWQEAREDAVYGSIDDEEMSIEEMEG